MIALSSCTRKKEKFEINKLSSQELKKRTKQTQNKQKEEKIMIKIEINETENRKSIEGRKKINEMKSWFSEKINQIGKPLAKLTKKKEKKDKSPI